MTIVEDGIGSAAQSQAQVITLESGANSRFLFLGGTDESCGAKVVIDGFKRAFCSSDDVALIVTIGPGASKEVDIGWLATSFDGVSDPDAELIDLDVNSQQLDQLLVQCQFLICMGEQAQEPSLARRAVAAGVAVVFPESCVSAIGLDHSTAYPVMTGLVAGAGNAGDGPIHPQDLAGVLRRVVAEPGEVAKKSKLAQAHCIDQEDHKVDVTLDEHTPPTPSTVGICWGAAAFNYSGYAKVTRTILSSMDRHQANYGFHTHGGEKRFVEELKANPRELEYWNRVTKKESNDGIYCAFHPPARLKGQSLYRAIRIENPLLKGLAAFTMFETDRLPQGWAAECNAADEVWVPCQFNIDSFTKGGVDPRKLKKLQLGIDATPFLMKQPVYEIAERRGFNFLSIFDWALRKGWDVLLRSYFAAFTADDDVSLTLRAYPAIAEQLPIRTQIDNFMQQEGIDPSRAPKIILIDKFVSESEMASLYQAADAFVMPSRGEGWGLPYMEAMATGLPTIGTRWSGQLEFMHDENSLLIDLEGLVPVFPEQTRLSEFYESHHLWAQPSTCHLKEIMRNLVANPAQGRELGKRAQEEVSTLWTADKMANRLYRLADDLDSRLSSFGLPQRPKKLKQPGAPLPSVAWTGPIYDASGYADEGRNFLHAMLEESVDVLTFPMNWTTRLAELSANELGTLSKLESTRLSAEKPAVMVQHTLGEILEPSKANYPCAGRTMFETDSLPPNWVARCNTLDKIWVPSQFNVDTFVSAGVEADKMRILHPAIDVDQYENIGVPIDFGSGKKTNFLSVFDWTERKGWDNLIRAWAQEFGPEDDVCLVLKVWSSIGKTTAQIGEEIEEFLVKTLGTTSADCAEILIYDHHIPEADMPRLYAGADAFVLPTRGEGWGRPIMEAMACGVLSIATNWSGCTEFMTSTNSLPIDFKLAPCSASAVSQAAWFNGHNWAEVHIPHLQFLMRCVTHEIPLLKTIAAQGRKDILARFDRKTVGARLRHLLLELSEQGVHRSDH